MNKSLTCISGILSIWLLLSFITHAQQIPSPIWAFSAGGEAFDEASSLAFDATGNIYLAGGWGSDLIHFGDITLTNNGMIDLCLVKYNPDGEVIWAKSAGGVDCDYVGKICTDDSGNIYITGSFSNSDMSFDNFTITNNGQSDMFFAKYDSEGNVIWAFGAGGSGLDYSHAVAVDDNGNVYVTGRFGSSEISFGEFVLENTENFTSDIFLVKLDSNGNVIWAISEPGNGFDDSIDICTDDDGNVIITGYFYEDITFGDSTFNAYSDKDSFLAKYNSNGNVIWAKSGKGNDMDIPASIASDDYGNVYMTGKFRFTITFDTITVNNPGGYDSDIYLVKYNSDGDVLWAKGAGGIDSDYPASVYVNPLNNIYLAGNFASVEMNIGEITLYNYNSFPSGYIDIFLAMYNADGDVLWAISEGKNMADGTNSICVDDNSNIYMAGSFYGDSISFGNHTLINTNYYSDLYIVKYGIITGILVSDLHNDFVKLSQNMPNPFIHKTTISYYLPVPAEIEICVYNFIGAKVSTIEKRYKEAGQHHVTVSSRNLSSGVYYYELNTGRYSIIKKMVVN